MLNEFNKRECFQLAIAPEGTRKKNDNWKSGFYYIALHAGVPITLAYIDYSKKEVGIFKNVYPTGNSYKDIEEIKQYYKHIKGKHPRQFSI
jgi:1-acyl-sn-glycerol-3-phosphate acyltransferase